MWLDDSAKLLIFWYGRIRNKQATKLEKQIHKLNLIPEIYQWARQAEILFWQELYPKKGSEQMKDFFHPIIALRLNHQ